MMMQSQHRIHHSHQEPVEAQHHHLLSPSSSSVNSPSPTSAPILKPSVKGERRYPCGFPGCKWVFTRSNHVLRHHQRVHPGYSRTPHPSASQSGGKGFTTSGGGSGSSSSTGSHINNKSVNGTRSSISPAAAAAHSLPHDLTSFSVPTPGPRVTPSSSSTNATKQANSATSPVAGTTTFTQSEADRFRELMSRSLIPCDEPDCDQTFKSPASLARHKATIHATLEPQDESGDEDDQQQHHHHHQRQNESLLLPPGLTGLSPADLIRAIAAAATPSSRTRNSLTTGSTLLQQSVRLLNSSNSNINHNNKPFICPVQSCLKSFTRRDHLKRHQVQSHCQSPSSVSPQDRMTGGAVILEEDPEDDVRDGDEDRLTISESQDEGDNEAAGDDEEDDNPSPRKKVRTTEVVLEDEENMTTAVTKTTMSTSTTPAAPSLVHLSSTSKEQSNNPSADPEVSTSRSEDLPEDEEMVRADEEDEEEDEDEEFAASAALILPAVAMEPEVVLEVDEDTVWTPSATTSSPSLMISGHKSGNNGSSLMRNQVLGSMDWTKSANDHQVNFSDDENDVSSSSFPEVADNKNNILMQDHRLMQQLILSRALLGSTTGVPQMEDAEGTDEAAIAIARTMMQQQHLRQQRHRQLLHSQSLVAGPVVGGKSRPYACDVPNCDKRYTKHSHLVRHKVETHKMQKPEPRNHQQHQQQQQHNSHTSQGNNGQHQAIRRTVSQPSVSSPAVVSGHNSSSNNNHPPPPPFNLSDRPYVCEFPGCRWSFKRQYHLDRHFLTHRQHQQNESLGDQPQSGTNDSDMMTTLDDEADADYDAEYEDEMRMQQRDNNALHYDSESGDMDMGYENYEQEEESADDPDSSQDRMSLVLSSPVVKSRSNGGSGGTSLLSPLNLKTSANNGRSPVFPTNPMTGSKGIRKTTSLMANSASALINATTGTPPVKINTTTPGNFTCCFPGCGIKCQSQSSFDAHLYLNHIVTNPLYNKKNKKSSADLINQTLLLLEQNAILSHCNSQQKQQHQQQLVQQQTASVSSKHSNHKNSLHNNSNHHNNNHNQNKCPPQKQSSGVMSGAGSRQQPSSSSPLALMRASPSSAQHNVKHSQRENNNVSRQQNHSNLKSQQQPAPGDASNNHNNNKSNHVKHSNSNNDLTMIHAYSLSLANLMNAVHQNQSSSPSSPSSHHHQQNISSNSTTTTSMNSSSHFPSIQCLPSPESSSSSPSDVEYPTSIHSSNDRNFASSGERKGEKALFTCDIEGCDKKFGRNCELTRHKLNHMDVWPFSCDHIGCGRKFKRKDVFKNHLRTHVKEFSSSSAGLMVGGRSSSPSSLVLLTSSASPSPQQAFTAASS